MTYFPPVGDPLDLEIEPSLHPGVRVRDLKSPAECASAIFQIDKDMSDIRSQIARAERDPASRPTRWRMKAQNAMTWKKRVRRAIAEYAKVLRPPQAPADEKRRVILQFVKVKIGEAEFERIVAEARNCNPELWGDPVPPPDDDDERIDAYIDNSIDAWAEDDREGRP